MSRPRVLVLGEKVVGEEYRTPIEKHLKALGPSLVMSDLAPGWNLMVAEEARKLNIPLMAVMPHTETFGKKAYAAYRKIMLKEATNKIVFNDSYYDFLRNPKPYVRWLSDNVDTILAYIDVDRSSFSHSLMLVLGQNGKRIFNTHKE